MNYRQPFFGEYPITQYFGETVTDPNGHTGIDYGCPSGTPILASAGGIVSHTGFAGNGYGNYIVISHEDGRKTLYAHLDHILVYTKMYVTQGKQIGTSGNTGNSTGPHLHFEIQQNGRAVDPLPFLQTVDDTIRKPEPVSVLKNADSFKKEETLTVVAPLGCKAFFNGFDDRTTFQPGTKFHYTGETTEHNGYTYMKVIPLTVPMWVAVHDGDTQILDKA